MRSGILFSLFVVLFLSVYSKAEGQAGSKPEPDYLYRLMQSRSGEGVITITMDSRIQENLQKHIQYNLRNPGIPGYRIRIFSDSGFNAKDAANDSRTRFITKYENIEAYIQYDIPNYKVYAGDCRTKSEAIKILEMVKKDFPHAFVVAQNINVPE